VFARMHAHARVDTKTRVVMRARLIIFLQVSWQKRRITLKVDSRQLCSQRVHDARRVNELQVTLKNKPEKEMLGKFSCKKNRSYDLVCRALVGVRHRSQRTYIREEMYMRIYIYGVCAYIECTFSEEFPASRKENGAAGQRHGNIAAWQNAENEGGGNGGINPSRVLSRFDSLNVLTRLQNRLRVEVRSGSISPAI